MAYRLTQTDLETQALLDKIQALSLATEEVAGLMSPEDKTKLDGMDTVSVTIHTTAEWQAMPQYLPIEGEIIAYSDHRTITKGGQQVYVPGLKIGTGNAYVADLPFIDDAVVEALFNHTSNTTVHVTANEKTAWSDKLNVDDESEVVNGVLILNRS